VLGLVVWAWVRDAVASLPILLLIGLPIALVTAAASMFMRQNTRELARGVARSFRLPWRRYDAVEHLKRVDLLEAFPLRPPRNELMATFFIVVIAALIGISSNPWLRARASNPSITIAREQAQRVQRLADSIHSTSQELDALRQLVSKGARTIDTRSNEPDAALNALQDLEEQVRQISARDDQLPAALAAIAGALASDPAAQQLANAINTGDMREISQAAKDLAAVASNLSGEDQQRVAKVLRDAAGRPGPHIAERGWQSLRRRKRNIRSGGC
jgi:hypothetical protein